MRSVKLMVRVSAGITILVLLMLCISYIAPEGLLSGEDPVKGTYKLASEEKGELRYFEGPVYFEFARKASRIENTPVFKLHFIHPELHSGNGFGFLITLSKDEEIIKADRYRVLSGTPKLGSSSETVFGYADVSAESASLYFTESGSISIRSADLREVSGEMNMWLKNAQGELMRLQGSFSAKPLNPAEVY